MPDHGAITLIGAGPVHDCDVSWAISHASRVIAADGGAKTALSMGLDPELVIGDMDSIDAETRERLGPRVLHVSEQDTTDFEKCLSRISAPFVLGLGFLGGRMDHSLAALSVLSRHPARCLLVGPEDVAFAAPREVALELGEGTRVSLFPLERVSGQSDGLRWPIDGIELTPSGRIGTSNESTGPVRLSLDRAGLIVLLPRTAADAALSALRR